MGIKELFGSFGKKKKPQSPPNSGMQHWVMDDGSVFVTANNPQADGKTIFERPDGSLCYATFSPAPTVRIDYQPVSLEDLERLAEGQGIPVPVLQMAMAANPEQRRDVEQVVVLERLKHENSPSGLKDEDIREFLADHKPEASFEDILQFRYMLYSNPNARQLFMVYWMKKISQ